MRDNRRKTSIEWPSVVDDRLRLLVQLAEASGEVGTTSASELLAALICAQPLDGTHLTATIATYRRTAPETIAAASRNDVKAARRPRRGRPRRARAKNNPHAGDTTDERTN
jgi:hypothetical protein